MTRTLKIIGCFVLLCWPALNDPAHIEAHRATVAKHAAVRDRLFLRKAMNQAEVNELRKEWK
jgi:D-alanyl-D-alanine dipeptidase